MASAVAIDVAIVATHLKIEIKTFLVTFILHFFTFLPFYLFTFKSVSFARYGRAALVTTLGVITTCGI